MKTEFERINYDNKGPLPRKPNCIGRSSKTMPKKATVTPALCL